MLEYIAAPMCPVGPICGAENCKGILINTINNEVGLCYRECDHCYARSEVMPIDEMLKQAYDTISQALKTKKD